MGAEVGLATLAVIATITREAGFLSDGRKLTFLDAHDARLVEIERADLREPKAYRFATSEDQRERERVRSSPFFGYSAKQIADWCAVDLETAMRWKREEAKPSPAELRLFELHRNRRILGDEWPAGWVVKRDVLVDPENNETTQGNLRAYALVYQHYRELMRGNDEAKQRFEEILRMVG